MRILLICERLGGRDDEGIKNLARNLLRGLSRGGDEVHALTARSDADDETTTRVPMNPYFLNRELLRRARELRPDAVLYVPWTSGTPRAYLRGAVVRRAAGARLLMLLSQPYELAGWARSWVRWLAPDAVLALDDDTVAQHLRLGIRAEFVPAGVDLARFRSSDPRARHETREALGVSEADRLVLHVGHLNAHRLDPEWMRELSRASGARFVIVVSPDTPHDAELAGELESLGYRVVREYQPRIERLYGAADAYLFPTFRQRSCIGVPLSVLEALACGTPVATTPFGGLPRLFPDSPCVRFATSPGELRAQLSRLPPAPDPRARDLVGELDWDRVSARVRRALSGMIGSAAARRGTVGKRAS